MASSDDLWKSLRSAESAKPATADDAPSPSTPAPIVPSPAPFDPSSIELPRSKPSPARQAAAPVPKASIAKWAAIGVLAVLVIALVLWAIVSTRAAKPEPVIANRAPAATTTQATPTASPATTSAATTPTTASTTRRGSLLNLNTATAAQLQALPGIGPAMAQRLIDKRASLGGFRSWDDVDAVEGIGPSTLEKLKSAATID